MMNIHGDRAVRAAMEIIRRHDPETYDRMRASDWEIIVMPGTIPGAPPQAAGATPQGMQVTAINALVTAWTAVTTGLPVPVALAATLVHEFVHTAQNGTEDDPERPAFQAMEDFARKLPVHQRYLMLKLVRESEPYEKALNEKLARAAA